MNQDEITAYAEKATKEIRNRIYDLEEDDAKEILLYVVARWAEMTSPVNGSPKFLIDAEKGNANQILDEAMELICPDKLYRKENFNGESNH